ncbi:hypothetical protein BDV96DRAFT_493403 [Lophiotrema nucula]|uniref:peptidylprolyl isomerase n=1 Tax=Lophiotrema nucula TaxID=690887 RepID=A0A6A5ZAA4_9PLEO|nr:hypothetical protein BDV96DRAFT_493403 [Lophiotrema nucula]
MAAMLPASVYGLRVPAGGLPLMATVIPGTLQIRITMAAIDPSADFIVEGDNKTARATLKLIRATPSFEDDSDEDDLDDIEAIKARLAGVISDDDSDLSEEEESEEEKNGGPSDPVKAKQAKREAFQKKLQEELDAEAMDVDSLTNGVNGTKSKGKAKASDDGISSEEDDSEDEHEEFVVCTLDPEKNYQQPLDITIGEDEEVAFVVNGTHDVFLTGNYVLPPYEEDDYEEGDAEDEHAHNMLDYDMSPDEDELDDEVSDSEDDALDGLADPRITEVDSDEEEAPKLVEKGKKGKNKRPAEPESDSEGGAVTLDELISKTIKPETPATNGEKLSKKQAKKLKKNDGQAAPAAQEASKAESAKKEATNGDKKKVQFSKNLEIGPTGSPKVDDKKDATAAKAETPAKTGPRNVGGVQLEDKKTGKGPAAKKGSKVEMRYIGKLKNGKVFDSNKKGKPFSFKLGVGEVIKGWDVGVAGMCAGGERRLTIPAKLAYGSKALPDIPANSDLVFDIKCLSVN